MVTAHVVVVGFAFFFFSLSPTVYHRKTAARPTSDVPQSNHYWQVALLMSEVIFCPWPITTNFLSEDLLQLKINFKNKKKDFTI